QLEHERIQHLTQQRELEWAEVQDYIDTQDCRMAYLADCLDDADTHSCGKCSACLGCPVIPETYPHELAVTAARYLRQAEFPLKCKVQVAAGAFAGYGFKGNLRPELRAETG